MKQFLILFREKDGRRNPHSPEEIQQHRQDWTSWMAIMESGGNLVGGKPLTLGGRTIKGKDKTPVDGPYSNDTEIVGGFLLMQAEGLEEVTGLVRSCPVFDFGGFAEIREIMDNGIAAGKSSADQPERPFGDQAARPSADQSGGQNREQTAEKTTEKNKKAVRRFNTAFIQDGDENAFHESIDPLVVNHTAPPGMSGGADGMFTLIRLFRNAIPDLTVEIYDQIAEDDLVVTRKAFHGTHAGEIMGIPPSGKKVVIPVIDIIRLKNGKYIEHWGIRDMSNLLLPAKKH